MFKPLHLQSKILILDDERSNVRLLERLLKKQHFQKVLGFTNPHKFIQEFQKEEPDIVLLDLRMPELNGFEVLDELSMHVPAHHYVPVLVLTGDHSAETKARALSGGAKDFLTKPFDKTEVLLRIRNLLQTRHYYTQLRAHNINLEETVSSRTRDLEQAQFETLARLAKAAEFRDDDTGQHAQRVGHVSALVAQELSLSSETVALLRKAAPLHDVGKIGIPDHILLKPGKLDKNEFSTIKRHTSIGAKILAGSRHEILQMAEKIALYHHENVDGTGYMGMNASEIPLPAQIVRAADVFDALTHSRPYKKAWTVGDALAELKESRGKVFNKEIIDAMFSLQRVGKLPVEGAPPPCEDFMS